MKGYTPKAATGLLYVLAWVAWGFSNLSLRTKWQSHLGLGLGLMMTSFCVLY